MLVLAMLSPSLIATSPINAGMAQEGDEFMGDHTQVGTEGGRGPRAILHGQGHHHRTVPAQGSGSARAGRAEAAAALPTPRSAPSTRFGSPGACPQWAPAASSVFLPSSYSLPGWYPREALLAPRRGATTPPAARTSRPAPLERRRMPTLLSPDLAEPVAVRLRGGGPAPGSNDDGSPRTNDRPQRRAISAAVAAATPFSAMQSTAERSTRRRVRAWCPAGAASLHGADPGLLSSERGRHGFDGWSKGVAACRGGHLPR
jgi:hypothetical protein